MAAWYYSAIVPGQLADLAVLSNDFFSIPEERIKRLESVMTIVGGKVVYATKEFKDLDPPSIPVLPEWSPVATYGGYYSTPAVPAAAKALHLCTALCNHIHKATCRTTSSLNTAGSLSNFWGGMGCDCFAF